ncbi:malto-oligosyltrehalose trehalohydrolase, partial [Streptomyces sp. URMC 123]
MLFEVWAPNAERVDLLIEDITDTEGVEGVEGRGRPGALPGERARSTDRHPMARHPARPGWWRAMG